MKLPESELYFNVLQVVHYGWKLLKFIMSKTFLRPKVSSTKVTDWVDPSFDDFSENTGISITATSLGVNNSSHRRKNVPSRLESSRFQARKREKPSSSEKIYGLENSKEYLSENEPWVDKYKPETQHELAVHKKKIEEVETWLKAKILERQPKQGGSILLITGPPGCGKTTTIKILSKEHGIQVQEWINPILPDFQKDDFKEILNPESSFHVFPYQSQIAVFKEFLLRATKYNKLQMLGDDLRTDKRIILVEDLPNQFYRNSHTLHEILRKYVHTGRCPLIFIISDSLSGDNNQRLLFPKEIQEECAIANISFNPVAPTIMMKFLNRIVTMEANKNGGNIIVPDKSSLELLCQGCSGDIRSAINSLQFSSSKGENRLWPRKKGMSSIKSDAALSKSKQRKKTDMVFESQEVQAIGGKDVSLFLFRALGKILYCKRASLTELDSPRLPSHLSEYERDTLLVQPEEVVEMSHMPGELFNLYLHQNYIDFFVEVDDLVRASDFLSFADTLSGDWNTRSLLTQYSTSIATRGVMHSNKARGFAHCQGGGSSFRPLHKPQWFLINKKYRENCLAAKALFSDFCLPALCLQTQLLPYLALLTIPMRNPAQISFIQDIGRLPLKRHFGRLRMEALTDREPGLIDADSGDEALLNGGQPAEEALGEPTQTAEPETFCLPLSQNSGSELPASQPQPSSVQGDMEEEELIIEDYESDGT
ncbi:cell cycle checkpoint protein RAD17 isoform X1 [Callorhinus ursinus]|uniref:Cell cycle checkpoint protein RAD17 n=2 Tax=Callorhinus ursinus TaxID=34884 RepID=A0A3Q7S555_CALUR|nr:cell cycle checkpoint protein RAD17 isoform X1 [Callorhinus ursinus]XP_025748681.1 cell cycle checkpoint protein RAD17 isoform X1 [Callorhinus ursinus]